MRAVFAEVRYALRVLFRTPSFSLFAVLALALGIGASTAIFSLIDAVLIRPLRFREPERLVEVFEDSPSLGFRRNTPAPANYLDWRRRNHAFADMAACDGNILNITGGSQPPEEVESSSITANLFPLLGVRPLLGRNVQMEENRPDAPKVALISWGVWMRRFGGRTSVIGLTVELDRQPYQVIGVMPRGFGFPDARDIWVPMDRRAEDPGSRDNHFLHVYARLKAGVTVESAQREMQAIAAQLAREHPETNTNVGSAVVSIRDEMVGDLRTGLFVLLGGVGCLLLIACANVASLLLARASGRRKELAVRAAVGASQWSLIRHGLLESLLLALAGGGSGALIAVWTIPFLQRLVPDAMAGWTQPRIDLRVLAFTFSVSAASALIFGTLPAVAMSRVELTTALQRGGRSGFSGSRKSRQFLVTCEVALSTVLLVGAFLLTQTLWNLSRVPLGFQPEHVLTARSSLPRSTESPYREFSARVDFWQRTLTRIGAIPGVVSAGATTFLPLTNRGGSSGFEMENEPAPPPGQWNDANHRVVTNGYLQTIGDRLVAGRYFDSRERPNSTPVAIVNEAMARKYWRGKNALGKRFRLSEASEPWVEIVGIVETVKQMGLDVDGRAEMYFPATQEATSMGYLAPRDFAVRVTGEPERYGKALRQAIWSVDAKQPVIRVQPMRGYVDHELAPRDIQAKLICAFAATALLLAALGLYGLLAFTVLQRVREIGVRMALGAGRAQVLRETLNEGMRLALAGVGVGVAGSVLLARTAESILFGVRAHDVPAALGAACLLLIVCAAACYAPARAAAGVDPMEALRYE